MWQVFLNKTNDNMWQVFLNKTDDNTYVTDILKIKHMIICDRYS